MKVSNPLVVWEEDTNPRNKTSESYINAVKLGLKLCQRREPKLEVTQIPVVLLPTFKTYPFEMQCWCKFSRYTTAS